MNPSTRALIEREATIQKLREWAEKTPPKPMLITGVSGVGKTELLLQFAQDHQARFPGGICWIQANSIGIIAGYSIHAAESFNLELPFTEAPNPKDRFEKIMHVWPDQGRVLIVIDDAASPSQIEGLIPTEPRFCTLVTSDQDFEWKDARIHLETLSRKAAKNWVSKAYPLDAEDKAGNLFLNLIHQLDVDFFDLRWLDAYFRNFLYDQEPEDIVRRILKGDAFATSQENSQQRIFDLIWNCLYPDAQKLATFISDLPPVGFPWRLIEFAYDEICDPVMLDTYRRLLIRYDFIGQRGESLFEMHPLVARCIRNTRSQPQSEQKSREDFIKALQKIARLIPECPPSEDWVNLLHYVPLFEYVMKEYIDQIPANHLFDMMMRSTTLLEGVNEYERAFSISKAVCHVLSQKKKSSPHTMAAAYKQHAILAYLLQRYHEGLKASCKQLEALQQSKHPCPNEIKHLIKNIIFLAHQAGDSELEQTYQDLLISSIDHQICHNPTEQFRQLQEKEDLLKRAGQRHAALECFWKQLELTEAHPSELSKEWTRSWSSFLILLNLDDSVDDMENMLQRSLKVIGNSQDCDSEDKVRIRLELVRFMFKQNRDQEAVKHFEAIMETVDDAGATSAQWSKYTLRSLARMASRLGFEELYEKLRQRSEGN